MKTTGRLSEITTRGREGKKKKALFEKARRERDVWRDSGKITMRGVLKPPFMSPKESKQAQEGLKKK